LTVCDFADEAVALVVGFNLQQFGFSNGDMPKLNIDHLLWDAAFGLELNRQQHSRVFGVNDITNKVTHVELSDLLGGIA